MTAFTTISNALVAVGAKPFATTIQALRDNILAVQEGDPTAPKIQLPAFPGIVGNARADHTGTTGVTVLLPYAGTWVGVDLFSQHTAAHDLRIRTSTDGGSTWSALQTLYTTTGPGGAFGRLILNRVTGAWDSRATSGTVQRNTGTTAGTINAIEFSCSVASAFGRHWLHYHGQA
jgi:hypothetical protein